MSSQLSVIIPTHDRPAALQRLLAGLESQRAEDESIEILVVDDGSSTPVGPGLSRSIRVLRRERGERSTARNHGAAQASGELLLFLDDDLEPSTGLLAAHLAAHREWPGCLAVGEIRLPQAWAGHPFGVFRQALELREVPASRGPARQSNFATAANMSLRRRRFLALGGFDPLLASAEDQDLALRHSSDGGLIVYLPDAGATHHDENAALAEYCRRVEWGAEHMVGFMEKHVDLPANRDRVRVNGPLRWDDPLPLRLKKIGKAILGNQLCIRALLALIREIEGRQPRSRQLPRLYRVLIGIHLQRGLRRGWRSGRRAV